MALPRAWVRSVPLAAAAVMPGLPACRSSPACPGSRSWTRWAITFSRASDWVRELFTTFARARKARARGEGGAAGSGPQGAQEGRDEAPPRIEPHWRHRSREASERAEKERQVPLFEGAVLPGELPPLSLLDDPPERAPGYSTESLEAISRLVELKLRDFGVEVEVVAVQPGPIDHALRAGAGAGREGQPDQQPVEGSRAFAFGDQRARGRSDPRQVRRWASRFRTRRGRW